MTRYIKEIRFEGSLIIVVDNKDSIPFEGKIEDYCPRILDRWLGSVDRLRQQYNHGEV